MWEKVYIQHKVVELIVSLFCEMKSYKRLLCTWTRISRNQFLCLFTLEKFLAIKCIVEIVLRFIGFYPFFRLWSIGPYFRFDFVPHAYMAIFFGEAARRTGRIRVDSFGRVWVHFNLKLGWDLSFVFKNFYEISCNTNKNARIVFLGCEK